MNPWQVLGVEPGSDRRTIKRAYSQQVKTVNPEDHPEAFMQLRQAYEWAMKTLEAPARPMVFAVEEAAEPAAPDVFGWSEPGEGSGKDAGDDAARRSGEESEEPPDAREKAPVIDDTWSESPREPEPRAAPIIDTWTDPPHDADDEVSLDNDDEPTPSRVEDAFQDRQEQLNLLVSAMSRLLDDPDLRNDLARWETLLMAPELNDFQASSAVSSWLLPQVIRVLQSGHAECPFEPAVLIRLDDRFQWSSDQSGTMPVINDQLLRLCLLIEAAREQGGRSRERMGWSWLAQTLFGFSGRVSRVECLLGMGVALGIFMLLIELVIAAPIPWGRGLATLLVGLVTAYSFIILGVKRVRDAGINPILAFVVGAIFPGAWLFFVFAAPKENPKVPDPRFRYSQVYDRTYREHYVADGKRSLATRFRERLSGIHPGIYLTIAGLWVGTVVLLSL